MVNGKFMMGATPTAGSDADAADAAADDLPDIADTPDEQMEQIEKMMRPLTSVHPAAIIAGTIVAGVIVLILVLRLMQKTNEIKAREETKQKGKIVSEDRLIGLSGHELLLDHIR